MDQPESTQDKTLLQAVQLWMDRIQVLTVVTTFFASTDGLLLGIVGTYQPGVDSTVTERLTYATLAGALTLHVSAAIISFMASFVLVRYKRINIPTASMYVEKPSSSSLPSNAIPSRHGRLLEASALSIERLHFFDVLPTSIQQRLSHPSSSDPLSPSLPEALSTLIRCNTVCVLLSLVGFILAVIGILSYVWTWLPRGVSIFTSICLFWGIVGGTYALQ